MPSPKDWTGEDWAAFTDHVRGSMQHGGIVDVGAEERWSVTHALGNATELASALRHGPVVSIGIGDKHWSVPHALSWNLRTIRDMNDLLATVLANQQAIMQAQGVVVDEAALAQQIAAIVVPAVVDEFGDEVGDEVESRIRQVLGALDEAT